MEVVERDVSDFLEAVGAADEELLELGRDGDWDDVGDGLSMQLSLVAGDDLENDTKVGMNEEQSER